jgi:hypothetical protein
MFRFAPAQLEEEEYTSRIIHYFSTGLLTLPEGSTLRSYLSEKLNCDPMRITKKYASAACLGRRAHHYRDERPQPTIGEIQLAKAQLDELEHRFRIRVEEGFPGAPLPSPSDMVLSLPQQGNQLLLPGQTHSLAMLSSLPQQGNQFMLPGQTHSPAMLQSSLPQQGNRFMLPFQTHSPAMLASLPQQGNQFMLPVQTHSPAMLASLPQQGNQFMLPGQTHSPAMLSSLPQHGNQFMLPGQTHSAAMLQSWLLGMAGAATQKGALLTGQPIVSNFTPTVAPAPAQWLLPSVLAPALPIQQ